MKKNLVYFSLLALFFVAFTIGCSNESTDAPAEETPQQNEETPNEEPKDEEPEATTRVVVDQIGREVELPITVNRVITTWRPSTNLLFAMNGQEKLVAVDTHSTTNEFLLGIYPEIGDTPGIGNRRGLNIEEMVAANPDVVFLWEGKDTEHVIDQLEQQGISAFVIVPETAEDMIQATLLMGEVINKEAEAKKAIDYYKDTIAMIQERIKDVPLEERPIVYLAGSGGLLNTMGQEYYQHFLIEQAGGINASGELEGYGWQDVSAEQLVAWNPDYLLVTQYVDEDLVGTVKSNPGLNTIKAIQNDQLYKFPSNITSWDFPEPLSVMGILWLANTLYPDEFSDMDFMAEVESYHQDFFGKTFTELGGNLDESERQSIK